MLKTQADQAQTRQSSQNGTLCRPSPMNRRQPSLEANASSQPLQIARPEGVHARLNQYASTCRPGCHCACHVSRVSATPALVDRVLGQLFVMPAYRLFARNVNHRSLMSTSTGLVSDFSTTGELSCKYRATNVVEYLSKDTRSRPVCQFCTKWKHRRLEIRIHTWIGFTAGCQ
jgi:hypothetical protein